MNLLGKSLSLFWSQEFPYFPSCASVLGLFSIEAWYARWIQQSESEFRTSSWLLRFVSVVHCWKLFYNLSMLKIERLFYFFWFHWSSDLLAVGPCFQMNLLCSLFVLPVTAENFPSKSKFFLLISTSMFYKWWVDMWSDDSSLDLACFDLFPLSMCSLLLTTLGSCWGLPLFHSER